NTHAYDLDLNGIYQQKNLATVLTSITELNKLGFNIQDANARLALSQVKKLTGLHGRWDVIQDNPHVILDVAHNEDGIRQVLHQLSILEYDVLHIVIGMVRDKDQGRILSMMPVNAKYYFTNAGIPRALPADELMKMAAAFKLEGDHYSNVNLALDAAKKVANNKDLILVCGSVFVVGEVNN
ncbi:MAG: cyanophycin synthetase, partial [Chitinophagaceae bacterium]